MAYCIICIHRGFYMEFNKIVYIVIAAFIIYCVAKIISLIAERKHKSEKFVSKLPERGYELIYSDQKQIEREEGVIYSTILNCEKLDISGKPDYIFRHKKKGIFPVELKSGEIKDKSEPHHGDLMQLAAYFAIGEEYFGETSAEGLIIYKDFMFRVKNTKRLRRKLKGVLSDMREMLKTGEAEPAATFIACKHCICKGTVCEYCDEKPMND